MTWKGKGSRNRNNPKDMANSYFCKVCGYGPNSCKCKKLTKQDEDKK